MYRHLFFDLDHTLWDFDKNSNEALAEMHTHYALHEAIALENFVATFLHVNEGLWRKHDANIIDQNTLRLTRFPLVFEALGIEVPHTSEQLSAMYLDLMPRKPHVLPYAIEVLEYLKPKYGLHIITNGFPEIQGIKLASANISHYFDLVVTSAEAGCRKPTRGIFDYTIQTLQTTPAACLMIGDNWEADIEGAKQAGLDQVYFNPKAERAFETLADSPKTYAINSLHELIALL